MKVSIHQPEHLVWLGLLYKIDISNVFVVIDDVQFTKNNFQNRNKIRIKDSFGWLTVPVKSHSLNTMIKDIEIAEDNKWRTKYLNTIIMNYGKAKYFKDYFPEIEKIINKNHQLLIDLNMDLLNFALRVFGFSDKNIVFSSSLSINPDLKKTDMLVQICTYLNATSYISGSGGREYLEINNFTQKGINVEFINFKIQEYNQVQGGFIPGMSFIDYLFNVGPVLPWKK